MTAPRTPQDRQTAKRAAAKKTVPAGDFAARARRASRAVVAQTGHGETAADPPAAVTTEQLAAEAKPPTARPEGMPETRQLVGLSRTERAEFLRAVARLQARLPEDAESAETAETADPGRQIEMAAEALDLIAESEKLMALVAVDRDSYAAWSTAAPDQTVMDAWRWYMESNPVGEAVASPT